MVRAARIVSLTAALALVAPVGDLAYAQELPEGAEQMRVEIVSPEDGTEITSNEVDLEVSFDGFEPACELAGTEPVRGKGHYHILIDGSLVNAFCTTTPSVSMQNLDPGEHTITVVPAVNDHRVVEANADEITIDFQPADEPERIEDASFDADPSISILSPSDGATIDGPTTVEVEIENFNANCDLFGRPSVAGHGHWHLHVDEPMLSSLAGMSCEDSFTFNPAGLDAGSHTLFAVIADNGHAPLQPMVVDQIEFTVPGEAEEPGMPATGDGSLASGGTGTWALVAFGLGLVVLAGRAVRRRGLV